MEVDGSRNVKAGDWAAGLHPVTRSRATAARAYDRMSSWSWLEEPFERRPRAIGLGLLNVQAGERVLELGCGAGGALIRLARAVGPSGCVVGLDLSPSMIRHAEARLRHARLADRVELRVADASSIPVEDASFDALFMSFTLELFDTPEIPIVLAECRRVLRSGGRLVVVALSRATPVGWPTRIYERLHDRFPAALDCRPIRAGLALQAAGFDGVRSTVAPLWGLRAEVVVAVRPSTVRAPAPAKTDGGQAGM